MKRIREDTALVTVSIPEKKVDITQLIKDVYDKVKHFLSEKDRITFEELIEHSTDKHEKIYTFIPLLHLDTQQKVNLTQEKAFGTIEIRLYT